MEPWIVGQKLRVPSLNTHRARGHTRMPVELVVLHYTAGASARSSAEWFRDPRNANSSAHFVIDRDGTVLQCVALDDRAWHAGGRTSTWARKAVNQRSIGIEIANWGLLRGTTPESLQTPYGKPYDGTAEGVLLPTPADGPLFDRLLRDGVSLRDTHVLTYWEPYPAAQLAAVRQLLGTLGSLFPILRTPGPAPRVVSHEEVDPTRKLDTGPLFPLDEARAWVEA